MELQRNTGYSEMEFRRIFGMAKCHLLKAEGPKQKMKFDPKTEKYINGEVEALEIETYFEGLGVQKVKLPKTFSMEKAVKDLAIIELISPEACVVNRNVYVRAQGIKVVEQMEKSNKLVAEVVASNLSLINMLATIGLETDNQATKVVVIEELEGFSENDEE